MKPTLLLLAAGIGSRYGGTKQLDHFGPAGETIMEYSLFDAIRAGFGKVVFIIREELKAEVAATFEPKLRGKIAVEFAIQGVQSFVPEELGTIERTKPWGTGHAMLCAWPHTQEPFAIINADDFYGLEAFQTMASFLSTDTDPAQHAMIAYRVKRTLSDNGTVARGVCVLDDARNLRSVTERTKIFEENGQIYFEENEERTPLPSDTPVSMNFWGFKPSVFPLTQQLFEAYARAHYQSPKAEFYIPTIVTHLIQSGQGACRVYDNQSDWFGVTYPDDKPLVQAALRAQHQAGRYPARLWD